MKAFKDVFSGCFLGVWSVFCGVFWVLDVSDLLLLCGSLISGFDVFFLILYFIWVSNVKICFYIP